jgi:hypothetical protein
VTCWVAIWDAPSLVSGGGRRGAALLPFVGYVPLAASTNCSSGEITVSVSSSFSAR